MLTLSLDAAPLDAAVRFSMLTALIGLTVMLPARWCLHAKRVCSYLVYYLAYRLLVSEVDGSAVVTVVSFGVRYARI